MNKLPKKIVIVGNGEDWQGDKIISFCQDSDYIIAADNGLSLLHRFNLMPDFIIGDLDSVSSSLLKHYQQIPIEKHPQKKDLTDSELCIQKAISMNPEKIILLAMTGNYFDHSYASIINLFRNFQSNIQMEIITSNSVIFPVTEKMTLPQMKGRRFSLFPLSTIKDFSMRGAQYNFSKRNLAFTDYSVSNVIIEDKLEIRFQEGKLFCVLFDKGFQ